MPGVTPIISGLPFFYIRGAPPGDVGYYLDGVRVPYLFHVGVGPSVIHPAMVDRVDLFPGGYPARFGRFAGGIVDGETVPPATEAHGEYNLRFFDAGAMVELPFDGGRGTLMLGGRYSYTGLLLSVISPDTVLSYWDYQARATYALTPSDRVGVFAFGADDFLGQKASGTTQTLFGTQFHRVDVRYDHRLTEGGTLRTAITFGQDLTDVGNGESVRDRLTAARTEIAYRASPDVLLRTGVDAEADKYDVVVAQDTLGPSESALAANYFPSRTDIAAGVRADAVLTIEHGLEVTPGARLDFFGSQGSTAVAVDPRLAARVATGARSHLLVRRWRHGHRAPASGVRNPGARFSAGRFKGGAANGCAGERRRRVGARRRHDRDSHRLPPRLLQHERCARRDAAAARRVPAGHVSNGHARWRDPGGVARSHMCGDRFPQGTLGADHSGGGGTAAEDSDTNKTVQALEAQTQGTAYGLELFVKRKLTEHFGGFLSYTLSRSTRTYGNQTFISAYDRTHVLNVAAAYDLGRNWRAGARVVFYTGLPKAPDPTDPGTRSRALLPARPSPREALAARQKDVALSGCRGDERYAPQGRDRDELHAPGLPGKSRSVQSRSRAWGSKEGSDEDSRGSRRDAGDRFDDRVRRERQGRGGDDAGVRRRPLPGWHRDPRAARRDQGRLQHHAAGSAGRRTGRQRAVPVRRNGASLRNRVIDRRPGDDEREPHVRLQGLRVLPDRHGS